MSRDASEYPKPTSAHIIPLCFPDHLCDDRGSDKSGVLRCERPAGATHAPVLNGQHGSAQLLHSSGPLTDYSILPNERLLLGGLPAQNVLRTPFSTGVGTQ